MKKAFILFYLAFTTLALNAQELKTITWGDQERQYLEYVPSTYSEERPAPLLFMLHGLGDNIENFYTATNITSIAEEKGWIVVFPQALDFHVEIPNMGSYNFGASWNAGVTVTVTFQIYGMPFNFDITINGTVDDEGFLIALLDNLETEYNIEQDSVFFAGFSLGGYMTHRMAIKHGDRINSIAAVSGLVGNDMASLTPVANVNVLQIFGTNDEMISYDGAMINLQEYGSHCTGLPSEASVEYWRSFNQCAEEALLEEYPDTQNDGLTFEMYSYMDGTNESRVNFLKVNQGLHRWYTGDSYDIDYNEEIFKFFTNTLDVTDLAEQTEETLTIYPNPAKDFITVGTTDEVELYDLCGKLVLQGSGKINVSTLPNGLYFVKSGSESQKLLINR